MECKIMFIQAKFLCILSPFSVHWINTISDRVNVNSCMNTKVFDILKNMKKYRSVSSIDCSLEGMDP